MSEQRKCEWIGYGFGASYMDAACVEGFASDMDKTGDEPGTVIIGDESCPQCGGMGVYEVGKERGPMALIRRRQRDDLNQWIEAIEADDIREEVREGINGMHALILRIEDEADKVKADRNALAAIVAKLPKTADGSPIVPGMTVWSKYIGRPVACVVRRVGPRRIALRPGIGPDSAPPGVLYATREAAAAAIAAAELEAR